jgi:hypothetical protein
VASAVGSKNDVEMRILASRQVFRRPSRLRNGTEAELHIPPLDYRFGCVIECLLSYVAAAVLSDDFLTFSASRHIIECPVSLVAPEV